jgi:hypothetical protein
MQDSSVEFTIFCLSNAQVEMKEQNDIFHIQKPYADGL